MSSHLTIRTEVIDGIWHVTLADPDKRNALSADMVAGLDAVLTDAGSSGCKGLVLRGEGRHFCAGFDLSRIAEETDDTLLARFVRIELLLQRVARAPFNTAAIAHGSVVGAGADLFAACSLRLAYKEATFRFPGARGFGLILGTRRLGQRIGSERALEWIESAKVIAEREARDSGLVHAIHLTEDSINDALQTCFRSDSTTSTALRLAIDTEAHSHDSRDLDLLVRSAARPGLRDRLTLYLEQLVSARGQMRD